MSLPVTEQRQQLIEKIIQHVKAVLGEADVRPQTGREHYDIGHLVDGASVASILDHTLLKPEATAREIEKLCFEAKEYGFASVCVNSYYVPLAHAILADTDIAICAVVGFPLGATLPHVKAYEAEQALLNGANEIDMVIAIGALKNRDLVALFEDITEVAAVCHRANAICKVIIETGLLTEEEKIMACQVVKMAGADFVKTSTGFAVSGDTLDDVALIRAVVGTGMGVKASGGIHNLAEAQAMIDHGANRIGSSAGVAIALEESGASADITGDSDY